MVKLAAPFVAKSGGRHKSSSAFNEGIQVPKADWAREVARNPALGSTNNAERYEATQKAILTGDLAKYRRR